MVSGVETSLFFVTDHNLHTSLGSLILGGLVATALSGVVCMQAVLYARLFEKDPGVLKSVVALVFLIDVLHTCMVWLADWQYLVGGFGDSNITDHVFWSAGLTIALTAITTITVQLFFSYRLYRLSKGNWFVVSPLVLLALARVERQTAWSEATSAELIRLGSFHEFCVHYRWLFTLGLALSSALDVMITSSLCLYLRKSMHGGSGRLDHVLDSVTLYTVENGMITCVATVLSLIFWLAKPHALIYLGLHFAISKLYANSFLASMNARKILRLQNTQGAGEGHRLPVIFAHHFSRVGRRSSVRAHSHRPSSRSDASVQVQITVDKTVDYVTDDVRQHDAANEAKTSIESTV
ncbi:hypothetical protein FOMPIDRAFT_1156616 [Fomitopsis schrenkii]|uniref:DUF6534 domain-containing protein n=1 Tax=Fomitopsis schrenkii TaxID=2126942 RepID=S8EH37_FOMSC|nr:hypothetical protein FOMPIDRAFT_1156616 [Fomitopsis schrenkii]